jgi:hypothetical protein
MPDFDKQGFEIIPDLFDRENMASVVESLKKTPLRHGRAGARNALQIECVRDLASDSRVVCIASNLLGGNAVPFRATLFDKFSRANWLVVWHQDTALALRERREVKGWGPWSRVGTGACNPNSSRRLERGKWFTQGAAGDSHAWSTFG